MKLSPASKRPHQTVAARRVFIPLVFGVVLMFSGCASPPPRNAAYPGGRDFLLRVAGKLQQHGFEVQNIQEGEAKVACFMEFVAATGTLTIGVTTKNPQYDLKQREAEFAELMATISGLGNYGLEVREFLYYPAQPHVVEFCAGKLIIRPPQSKSPVEASKK